jgi:hypothetical protein
MNESEAEAATIRAIEEGRVNGKYRCPRCGMRSHVEAEAQNCCKELGPPASQKVPDARFERLE